MLGSVSRGASRSAAGFLSLVLVAWASGGCRRETPAANESGLSAKKPVTLILGGYTTFSSMQLDAAKLAGKRGGVPAASYLLLSVLVGQLAAALGGTLARAPG